MSRILGDRRQALLTGIVLVVASGVVHGLWTDRWGWSDEPQASAAKLAGLKTCLGDWDMVQESSLSPGEQASGGIVGYVVRRYVQRGTGKQVQMYLLCGRPRHISVHTPDVCFEGAGYQFSGSPERKADVGQPGNEFMVAQCAKQTIALPEHYRIYWAWLQSPRNAACLWQAPGIPRLTFARSKALFKLYVIESLPSTGKASNKDSAQEFMRVLLPELKILLFSETSS